MSGSGHWSGMDDRVREVQAGRMYGETVATGDVCVTPPSTRNVASYGPVIHAGVSQGRLRARTSESAERSCE